VLHRLGPVLTVPANASRFFDEPVRAKSEESAKIGLAWDDQDPYLFNSMYDESLIKYDEQYCTAVSAIGEEYVIPALAYFQDLQKYLPSEFSVIDIGCGQGEFVEQLRTQGIQAAGYDPVLKSHDKDLHARYWSAEEPPADLYVMRCVLPHVPKPWAFLAEISRSSPSTLVLVEFQRLEWIIENKIWYQLSHDHVNLFALSDFSARYKVRDSGTFSNGEWGWTLLDPATYETPVSQVFQYQEGVSALFEARNQALQRIASIKRPVAVWGAAGKGIVLVHALTSFMTTSVIAIDADSHRWNKYLECSGIQVMSPESAMDHLPHDLLILVSNPNHLDQVRKYVNNRFEVQLPIHFAY
jgi:SAM-dependent methyltransferase